jgi:KDO2-lipid IV(A) lauroyltransferase
MELISESPSAMPEGFITEEYIRLAEKAIKAQPYAWLWSHKRWKHRFPGKEEMQRQAPAS